MQNSPSNHLKEILVGLFITVVGGILVAWIIREGDLFSTNNTLELIAIPVTNNDCSSHAIYVDGVLMINAISPSKTVVISTTPGEHLIQECQNSDDESCESPTRVVWENRSEYVINLSPNCPITITLTNNACKVGDFYVDGTLVVTTLAPGNSIKFTISPGTHLIKNCIAGTDNCSDTSEIEWLASSDFTIVPSSSPCSVIITLTNNACEVGDFYVDGTLVVTTLAPGNSTKFTVSPGTHLIKNCIAGTDNCSDTSELEWLASSDFTIVPPSSPCP